MDEPSCKVNGHQAHIWIETWKEHPMYQSLVWAFTTTVLGTICFGPPLTSGSKRWCQDCGSGSLQPLTHLKSTYAHIFPLKGKQTIIIA